MGLPWILTLALKVYGPWIIYLWSLTPCLLFSYPLSLNNPFLLSGLLMLKMRGKSELQLQVSYFDCHSFLFYFLFFCFGLFQGGCWIGFWSCLQLSGLDSFQVDSNFWTCFNWLWSLRRFRVSLWSFFLYFLAWSLCKLKEF